MFKQLKQRVAVATWSKAGEANGGSIMLSLPDHTVNLILRADGKPEKNCKQKRIVTRSAFLNQV